VLITTKQDDRLNKHDVAINNLQAQVRNVSYVNDSLNQYYRRENVRISTVPEAEDEDLTKTLFEIADSVGVVIKPVNINAIHRNGPIRQGKAKQILARFVHREPRFQLLKNRADLRKTERLKNIYISEDLTHLKFKLLYYAKKQGNVKSLFSKEGMIHCILDDDSKVTIDTPDDLFKIGMDNIDLKALGLPEF
jgi:anion-transporting  ArsA/GET3 family ATPase